MSTPAPNYTQAPNLFFDQTFKELKEGELRVILALIRQTFGWHKSFDRISLSQLAEMTGMERKSVCRSLNSLIAKGLVVKKKFGVNGRERCYYALVIEQTKEKPPHNDDGIETEEEMQLFSNNFDQCPKDTGPVSLGHPPSVFRTPTKETKPKEKETTYYSNCTSAREPVVVVSLDQPKKEAPRDVVPTKPQVLAPGKPHIVPQVLPPGQLLTTYQCLDSVNLSPEQKLKITQSFSEQAVAKSVAYILSQSKPPKNLGGYLNWACKAPEVQNIRNPEDVVNGNKQLARQLERQVVFTQGVVRFDALSSVAEFVYITSCKQPDVFKYEDPNFEAKVKSKMKEFEFTLRQTDGPKQISRGA